MIPASPLTQTLIVKRQTHLDQIRYDFRPPFSIFCKSSFSDLMACSHPLSQYTHLPSTQSDDTLPGALQSRCVNVPEKFWDEVQLKMGLKLMELQRLTCRVMKRTPMQRLHRGQRCTAWTAAHSLRRELLSPSPAASAASHALPTDVRIPAISPQPCIEYCMWAASSLDCEC